MPQLPWSLPCQLWVEGRKVLQKLLIFDGATSSSPSLPPGPMLRGKGSCIETCDYTKVYDGASWKVAETTLACGHHLIVITSLTHCNRADPVLAKYIMATRRFADTLFFNKFTTAWILIGSWTVMLMGIIKYFEGGSKQWPATCLVCEGRGEG